MIANFYYAYFFLNNQPISMANAIAKESNGYGNVSAIKASAKKSLAKLNSDYGEPHKAVIFQFNGYGNFDRKFIGRIENGEMNWHDV